MKSLPLLGGRLPRGEVAEPFPNPFSPLMLAWFVDDLGCPECEQDPSNLDLRRGGLHRHGQFLSHYKDADLATHR
jgi:hypothetical protein